MNSSLYSNSKISPPRLPRIYPRQRLIKRLKDNQDKKICFILGQAAQGKSTLAAQYLSECSIPWTWLNLNPEDSDPVNLFYSLAHALRPGISPPELAALFERPSPQMGVRAEIPQYRGWSTSLYTLAKTPLLLVLDGLDRLGESGPSFLFLQVFGQEAPDGFYLQVLSRVAPPFNIHDLKMRREAFIMDNSELSFTTQEVKGFFKTLCGLSLSSDEALQVRDFTEGWAGGLILLSDHVKKMEGENRFYVLTQKMQDGLRLDFYQYFADTIFSNLPEEEQDFLLKSSMFDVIDPGLMNGLGTSADGFKILDGMAQRNMFVNLIHDQRAGVAFRLHQVFREFLQDKYEKTVGQELVRHWKSKAGELLRDSGHFEQALELFIQAKDYSKAATILHDMAFAFYIAGRTGDLRRYIESFPQDLMENDPWLTLYYCMINRFKAGTKLIDALLKTLDTFKKNSDTRGILLNLTVLSMVSVDGRMPDRQYQKLLQEGEAWLNSKAAEPFPYERTLLTIYTGIAHVIRGDLRQGASMLKKAYPEAVALEQPVLVQTALLQSASAAVFLGELDRAEELHKKTAELLSRHPDLYLHHQYMGNRALEFIYKGEKEKAKEAATLALSHAEDNGLLDYYGVDLFNQVYCSAIFEDIAGLKKAADRFLSITASGPDQFYSSLAYGCLGYGHYRVGQWSRALEFMDKAVDILSREEGGFKYQLSHMYVVRNLIASSLPGSSVRDEELLAALKYFKDIASPFLTSEALLARAIVYRRQGRMEEVEAYLKEGFQLARGRTHPHFIMLSRTDVAGACALALEMELEETEDYATFLLTTSLADVAEPELERLQRCSNSRVADNAAGIRHIIHRAGKPPLHIKTLGGFQVLRGGEAMEDKSWGGVQSQTMIKALLSLGPISVPKDQLMECLWPEVDISVQKKNFKVAVHRLRKALEPAMEKTFGSSYLHVKDSLVCMDEELCQLDTVRFYDLINAGDDLVRQGDHKAALKTYSQAADLYQGDFLADDLYSPWVREKRAQVKTDFLDLMLAMAKLYEDSNTNTRAVSCYRKVLATDGCHEEACQRLMVLYDRLGKHNKAESTYKQLRQALWEELESEPDELTRSIYERMKEKN